MIRRRPLAAAGTGANVPLEHLAASVQALSDRLAAATGSGGTEPHRPRLQLVGVDDAQRGSGDAAALATRTRAYLRARRLREGLFPEGIFADPAWDMLLDLFACKMEGSSIGVLSACSAAGVPQTTALRWIDRLEECGLVRRRRDPVDSRRIYVELTEVATRRIELWLDATFRAEAAE
jgi:DNA-binding transcriptional ArsR family regulator